MSNYTEQLNQLRAAAVKDIRACIEREGETVVVNHNYNKTGVVRIDGAYTVLDDRCITTLGTKELLMLADAFNLYGK